MIPSFWYPPGVARVLYVGWYRERASSLVDETRFFYVGPARLAYARLPYAWWPTRDRPGDDGPLMKAGVWELEMTNGKGLRIVKSDMSHVSVLDCTIRDGGLVNGWDFSQEFVADLYRSLSLANVDVMEVGYKNSPKLVTVDNAGPWAFLDEGLLKETITKKTNTKLSALVDIGRVDENDILPREKSLLDLIRVACYAKDVDKAIDLVNKFHDMGYETSVNLMAVSTVPDREVNEALAMLSRCPVDMVYVVDSFGSLYPSDIIHLVRKFQTYLPEKVIGMHTHNNLQLAFANTLTGAQQGARFLDSSVFGMGRAAGNCPTELLVGHLEGSTEGSIEGSRYSLLPILDILERRFVPLRNEVEWGYTIPYAITGLFDEHPRSAILQRQGPDKDQYVDFYEKLTDEESVASRA